MPSTILRRTISAVVDQRIILSLSNWCRPHGFTTWTKLRFALRWCMRDSGATLTGTPNFYAGFCSGETNIIGDGSVTHFVGVKTTGTTWPRIAGPPTVYQLFPTQSGKVIATTFTSWASWLSVAGYTITDVAGGNRGCWFIDVTKGSPNFTVNGYARINGTAGDISEATFLSESEIDAATLTNHALGNSGSGAVSEGTNGALDHVCMSWDRTTPEIEISSHRVVRLA